jgi:uncharacterized repeat protein (TIGR01451 family)
MQYFKREKITGLLAALVMFIGGTSTALAVGTASGITVTNTATVDYAVGGNARSASDSVDFLVDNRVDLTVTGGSAVNVAPGSTNQVLVFTVTNTGNTTQGYAFTTEPTAAGATVMTNVRVYIDDGNGTWDGTGTETLYVAGNNAGDLDPNGAPGADQMTVFIVSDTPAGATDGQTETFDLIATTLNAGTTTATTASVAPSGSLVTPDVVFADGTGTHTGAADRNGIHSASGTYTVASAALSAAKTITGVVDEFGTGYEIPNAVVSYQIVISNTGTNATDANTVVLTDPVPAGTKFCIAAGSSCTTGPNFAVGTSGLTAAAFEYSDDNGATWTYSPTADAQGADTNITNIRYQPTGAMSADPSSFTVTFEVVIE